MALEDWGNMAYGGTSVGIKLGHIESADACNAICVKDEGCFQSRFDGWECKLLNTGFAVGKPHNPVGHTRWESYWNASRIDKWVTSQKACPARLKFPHELHG